MVDTSILDTKTYDELKPVEKIESESNLIEPTDEEVLSVIDLLKQGKTPKEIKLLVIREVGTSKLKLSYSQIKEIEDVWLNKIASLRPE